MFPTVLLVLAAIIVAPTVIAIIKEASIMYQVKVLKDKVWHGVLRDSIDRDVIVMSRPEYGNTYITLQAYKDAADLYDFVLREFHKDTQYDDLSAVKFVAIYPTGREREVLQYKQLVRRK